MRSKRNSLYITLCITAAILCLALLFRFVHFPNDLYQLQNFCIIALLCATSGALVALIIFFEEYRSERRKAMEKYCSVAIEALAAFRKLKYFLAKEPNDLLARYYDEVEHNTLAKYLCDQRKKDGDTKVYTDSLHTVRYDVLDEWCKLLDPGYFSLREKMDADKYRRMVEDEITRRAEEYLTQINQVVDSYVELCDGLSFEELDNIYEQMGFFTGQKPILKIYNDIHKPLHIKMMQIQTILGDRLGMYKSGEDPSCAHVLQALIEVQNDNFTAEVQQDKNGTATVVFNDFYTGTAHVLEDLRAKLYGVEPQYPKRYCVRSALNL